VWRRGTRLSQLTPRPSLTPPNPANPFICALIFISEAVSLLPSNQIQFCLCSVVHFAIPSLLPVADMSGPILPGPGFWNDPHNYYRLSRQTRTCVSDIGSQSINLPPIHDHVKCDERAAFVANENKTWWNLAKAYYRKMEEQYYNIILPQKECIDNLNDKVKGYERELERATVQIEKLNRKVKQLSAHSRRRSEQSKGSKEATSGQRCEEAT
jgi:hypothetical protein